jgi:hypothetical protein
VKRPWFQFYPADWRNDAALRLVSLAARGLWWEMLCIMHMAEPYGHLVSGGRPIDEAGLARLVSEAPRDVSRWLAELRGRDIFSVTDTGCIYSRRMVRDEKERADWRARQGRHRDKGGDVTPPVTPPVTPLVTPGVTPPVTAMSRRSSLPLLITTTSKEEKRERGARKRAPSSHGFRLDQDWALPDDWRAFARRERPGWSDAHVDRVAQAFADYWHATAGAKARKVDWFATWRTWVRRETTASPARQSRDEQRSATAAALCGNALQEFRNEAIDVTPIRPAD